MNIPDGYVYLGTDDLGTKAYVNIEVTEDLRFLEIYKNGDFKFHS